MSREDYIATLLWFRDNHAEFVPQEGDGFPAHWMLFDGSYFLLSSIEACDSFDEVRGYVLGEVAA